MFPPCWESLESENGDYYTSLPEGTKRIWVKAWDYAGVPLVAGRKTVVRLFAGIENSNNNTPLTGSTAELRCYNSFSHQPCPRPQKAIPEFNGVAFPNGLTLDVSFTTMVRIPGR